MDARQYKEVRTANFKEWAGDWERSAQREYLEKGKAVTSLTGNEFARVPNKSLTQQVGEYFRSIGGKAQSPIFGDVIPQFRRK